MRSTAKLVTVNLVTAGPSTDYVRIGRSYGFTNEWGTTRYKAKKGRAVTKKERATYDLATELMLAGRIKSFHVYEDGWTFTNYLGGESAPFTLELAKEYLAELATTELTRKAA